MCLAIILYFENDTDDAFGGVETNENHIILTVGEPSRFNNLSSYTSDNLPGLSFSVKHNRRDRTIKLHSQWCSRCVLYKRMRRLFKMCQSFWGQQNIKKKKKIVFNNINFNIWHTIWVQLWKRWIILISQNSYTIVIKLTVVSS